MALTRAWTRQSKLRSTLTGRPKPPLASGAAADGRPTEAEIAGFPAFKALVDAALDAAVH